MKQPTRLAQDYADRIRQETGAPFVVVLLSDGATSFVGAQVPELKVLRDLLENALASLQKGSASVTDLRKQRS